MSEAASRSPSESSWRLRDVSLVLAFCVAYLGVFPYFEHLHNPNENTRVYQVVAVVEQHTLALNGVVRDPRFHPTDDRALHPSRRCAVPGGSEPCAYPSKAPGTLLLGVPAYAIGRLFSTPFAFAWTAPRITAWLRLGCTLLPTLAFLVWFARDLRRSVRSLWARALTLSALGLGSGLYTHAHLFAGHQWVALAVPAACMLLDPSRGPGSTRRTFAAGALAGLAAVSEYPAAVLAGVLFGFALVTTPGSRMRTGLAFLSGAAPFVLFAAAYHSVCFGAPWRTGYATLENPAFTAWHRTGFMGITWPGTDAVWRMLVSPARGLFFFASFLVLALPGFVRLLRRQDLRPRAVLTIVLVALGVLFQSGQRPELNGWAIGPRFVVYLAPLLAWAAAHEVDGAVARNSVVSVLAGALGILSIGVTFLSTVTFHAFPQAFANPFFDFVLPLVRLGFANHGLGTWLGLRGLVALSVVAAPVGVLSLFLLVGPRLHRAWDTMARAAVTLALACGLFALASRWDRRWTPETAWEFSRLTARWEPAWIRPQEDAASLLARGWNRTRVVEGLVRQRRTPEALEVLDAHPP